ncbi:hypothetical protein ACS0TY_035041 [Phlomoides rotata]
MLKERESSSNSKVGNNGCTINVEEAGEFQRDHAYTKSPNLSRKLGYYEDRVVVKSVEMISRKALVGVSWPILGPTESLDLNQPCWARINCDNNLSKEYEFEANGQGESNSMSESIPETSMEYSRDLSEIRMEDLDDGEGSEEEERRSKRKKKKRNSKKKEAVISREELRWIWYDDSEVTITEAEKTWNLGKQLGIKSLKTDSSMAKKIEKMICLENGDSIKGKKQSKGEVDLPMKETKVEEVDKRFCKLIWGNSPSDWAWLGSVGNSGGILTIWKSEVF